MNGHLLERMKGCKGITGMQSKKCFKYLNSKHGDYPISDKASKEVLSIPMNSFLKREQIGSYCQNN